MSIRSMQHKNPLTLIERFIMKTTPVGRTSRNHLEVTPSESGKYLKCRVITSEGVLRATVNVRMEGDYFCFGNTTHYVLHPRECVDVKKIVVNVLSAERYAKLLSA